MYAPTPYRTFKRMNRREANDFTDIGNPVKYCFYLSVALTPKARQIYKKILIIETKHKEISVEK